MTSPKTAVPASMVTIPTAAEAAVQSKTEEYGAAGFMSCTINLLKSVIGAGILAIPLALGQLGWLPGVFILIFAATLSSFGLFLLSIIGHWNGRKSTFGSVAEKIFPRAAWVFDLTVTIKCLGVAVAYLVGIVKQIPSIVAGVAGKNAATWIDGHKFVVVIVVLILLAPIVAMPKMDSLKYTSFFGIFSIIYLVFLTIYQFISTAVKGETQRIPMIGKIDFSSLGAFSVFVFAFNCHQNIFPIQNEAAKNTPKGMFRVILTVMVITLIVYVTFSICASMAFTDIHDNILNTFPLSQVPFIIARILFVLLLGCSYPLQTFPCRMSIERMVSSVNPKMAKNSPKTIYWGATAFILLLSGLIASLDFGFAFVLKVIGSTAGPVICFFFPSLLYLRLSEMDGFSGKLWVKNGARALLIVSILTTILSIVLVIMEIISKTHQ